MKTYVGQFVKGANKYCKVEIVFLVTEAIMLRLLLFIPEIKSKTLKINCSKTLLLYFLAILNQKILKLQ